MNGRVYDYNLGRFLSVDPFIQAPGNSQSINPYTYIMNNPLAGTDPTGYVSRCDKAVCGDQGVAGLANGINQGNRLSGIKDKWLQKRANQQSVISGALNRASGGSPDIGSQSDISQKNFKDMQASKISDKYGDTTSGVGAEMANMDNDPNDLGQTASRSGRGSAVSFRQSFLNLRYNVTYNQILRYDSTASFVRPSNRNVTRQEVAVMENMLQNLRGPAYWPLNAGASGPVRNTYLRPGNTIDRYGREGGTYASPLGTSFPARALPVGSASAPYNQYRVLRPIHVRQSTIAPAFGQMGGGTQYQLPVSVRTLIRKGYLERVNK